MYDCFKNQDYFIDLKSGQLAPDPDNPSKPYLFDYQGRLSAWRCTNDGKNRFDTISVDNFNEAQLQDIVKISKENKVDSPLLPVIKTEKQPNTIPPKANAWEWLIEKNTKVKL